MTDVASLIADMVREGVDPEIIGRVAQAMTDIASVPKADEQAERRRAADRERKARLRNSAESADNPSPLCPPLSLPQTPTQAPPISPQPTMSGKPDPVPVKTKPKAEYAPAFLLLWDTFPKHPNASKLDAFKSWTSLSQQDQDLCLDGAVRYIDFLEKERRRRPDYPQLHLATFINSRRWEALLEDAA